MLLTCYLASAALFYLWVSKRAPVMEASRFEIAALPHECEVIELFASDADQAARKAA